MPNDVILNRFNILFVGSQLKGTRLRWLGHVFWIPNDRFEINSEVQSRGIVCEQGLGDNDRLPRKVCLMKSRSFAHLAALGLVSVMLHCVIVKTVELVNYRPWDAQDRLHMDKTKSCPVHT